MPKCRPLTTSWDHGANMRESPGTPQSRTISFIRSRARTYQGRTCEVRVKSTAKQRIQGEGVCCFLLLLFGRFWSGVLVGFFVVVFCVCVFWLVLFVLFFKQGNSEEVRAYVKYRRA